MYTCILFFQIIFLIVLGDCDFQKDFCTWSNMASDDFDWIRDSGGTPSRLTGPGSDRLGKTSGNLRGFEGS